MFFGGAKCIILANLTPRASVLLVKFVKMARARGPKIGFWKMLPPSPTMAIPLFGRLGSWCTKRAWNCEGAQTKVKNYSFREFSGPKTPPAGFLALQKPTRWIFFRSKNYQNPDEKSDVFFFVFS